MNLREDLPLKLFSLSKSECLMQPIQMLFSRNRKILSQFFAPFLKST